MAETWGGLVESRENCAYCAAWPSLPCALHRRDHTCLTSEGSPVCPACRQERAR